MLKKHMTPFKVHAKTGDRVVHKGKGATEQSLGAGQRQSMTEGDPMDRMQNNYAKASPPPAPPSTPPPAALGGGDSGADLDVD